jgi:hypothetical protein
VQGELGDVHDGPPVYGARILRSCAGYRLAAIELRCILTTRQEERIWRDGLVALISEFCPPAT